MNGERERVIKRLKLIERYIIGLKCGKARDERARYEEKIR